MAEIFFSQAQNFGNLLGRYAAARLTVPQFQRGYSWEKEHVATFWDDLIAFHKEELSGNPKARYFLGPIVVMTRGHQTVVLDGQQRLATATIAFSAMRDVARSLAIQPGTDEAAYIQRDFIEDDGKFSLDLNETDKEFFRGTVQKSPAEPLRPQLKSHIHIANAREYLFNVIAREVAGLKPAEAAKAIKRLKETLATRVMVVAIHVDSEDDAYRIFETLNDRGLRLSVPDLLLNFLMHKGGTKPRRAVIREHWTSMLETLEKKDADRFLRHLWLSRYGDVKARGLFKEIKAHLSKHQIDAVTFAVECDTECDDYVAIVDVNKKRLGAAEPDIDALVRQLNAQVSLPILLSGLKCLDQNEFAKLARMVLDLFVRHSIIANLNPYDLEDVLYRAARVIREQANKGKKGVEILREVRKILATVNPPDRAVQEATGQLLLNRSQARYIVTALARQMQSTTKEITTGNTTLEHIFPQRPSGEWKNGDALRRFTWHIGNLTILGGALNRAAASKGFVQKLARYRKSEIKMTQAIAKNHQQWTEQDVLKRAGGLGPIISSIWRGPQREGV